jgi:hypothetical protein
MRTHGVHCLLMGGQACVFYGAAEFSRDTDFVLLASPSNLDRFSAALTSLHAQRIAVPPFEADYLHRGHAVHFRCQHPDAAGFRIDVMSVMRGVAPFDALWERRTTIETTDGEIVDLLSLEDLVLAKKTQRDKDWPMVRRLVEVHYLSHRARPEPARVTWWLAELRTAMLLVETASRYPDAARAVAARRIAVARAIEGDAGIVEEAMVEEERVEREADRRYWLPLRQELERLRHSGR